MHTAANVTIDTECFCHCLQEFCKLECAIFGVPVCICDDSTFYADLCGLLPIPNSTELKKKSIDATMNCVVVRN